MCSSRELGDVRGSGWLRCLHGNTNVHVLLTLPGVLGVCSMPLVLQLPFEYYQFPLFS